MKLSIKTETALLIAGIVAIYIFLIAGVVIAGFFLSQAFGNVLGGLAMVGLGLAVLVPLSKWLANRLS